MSIGGIIVKSVTLRFDDELHQFIKSEAHRLGLTFTDMAFKILRERKDSLENFENRVNHKINEAIEKIDNLQKISRASLRLEMNIFSETSKAAFFSDEYFENQEPDIKKVYKEKYERYLSDSNGVRNKIVKDEGLA